MPTIFKMLDLSTAHLPENLGQNLTGAAGVTAQELEYGWLLYVPQDIDATIAEHSQAEALAELARTTAPPDDPNYHDVHHAQAEEALLLEEDQVPEAIIAIWRYAEKHGCKYVMLDRDADETSDLPTWEW
jgi:hypothetical protein